MKIYNQHALISTYDKSNLGLICQIFSKYNIGIISTGSTGKYIKKLGFQCLNVSNLTRFKEILNGRVKTLHPKIHASILYDRNDTEHKKTFTKLKSEIICAYINKKKDKNEHIKRP
mgnify:CR=1 FL=1